VFEWLASSRFALWWLPEAAWSALPLALCGALWLLLPRGVPGKPLACCCGCRCCGRRGLPARGEAELLVMDVGQGWRCWCARRGCSRVRHRPGCRGGFDAGERVVLPAMQVGSGRADRIVVSHADADHAGSLAALRRSMPRADVLARRRRRSRGGRVRGRGGWQWDGVRFRFCIHRRAAYLRNESSCVLRIETAHGVAC
jgi:competence protein ComEC